jgi:hypothetical protein
MGDAQRIDAARLLAHEGARGTGDAVDDADIAREQVRELRQEQGRPQVVQEPLVEEGAGIVGPAQAGEDGPIDRIVALAAARRHHERERRLEGRILLHPGRVEGEAGGIDAEPLPQLHLALVRLLRDLRIEGERRDRVHRVGREGLGIRPRRRVRGEGRQMRLDALPRAGDESDSGDDDVAGLRAAHGWSPSSKPIFRARSRIGASSPAGNGMVRNRSSASQSALPSWRIAAFVTA